MPCPTAALPPLPALAVWGSAAVAAATGNEVHGARMCRAPCGDMVHTVCWVGHHSADLRAKKAGALLTSPVPCTTLGAQPSKAAAMSRNCKARTGPPQYSQPLIVSRHPVLTPHLHLIYSMEPEGPRGMAVAGAVARTELLWAEAGTLGVLLVEQLAPQSWLQSGQGTVVLLWRMWLVGGSMLCQPRRQRISDCRGSQSPGPGQGGAELGQQHQHQGTPRDKGHAPSSASRPCGWLWSHSQTPGPLLSCLGVPMGAGESSL